MLLDDLVSYNGGYNNNYGNVMNLSTLYIPYSIYNSDKLLPYRTWFNYQSNTKYFYKNNELYIFPYFASTSNKINYGPDTCHYYTGDYLYINLENYNFYKGKYFTKCFEYNGTTLTSNTTVGNLYSLVGVDGSSNLPRIGTSYLDDLIYSNQTTNILVSMLYIAIPLILFILGLKVLRKGLFK